MNQAMANSAGVSPPATRPAHFPADAPVMADRDYRKSGTIPQILRQQAVRWPNRVFMRHKKYGIWQEYTFAQVFRKVKTIAAGLSTLGMKPGGNVLIVGENEPEMFWGEWAVQCLGGAVACMYPDSAPDEIAYQARHLRVVIALLEDQEQVDKLLSVRASLPDLRYIIYWDERGMWNYRDAQLRHFREVEASGLSALASGDEWLDTIISAGKISDVGAYSWTSGTTGAHPKPGIMTYHYLLDHAWRAIDALQITPFVRYVSAVSPASGASEQVLGLTAGVIAPMVIHVPEEPETVRDDIREIGPHLVISGPKQWEWIVSGFQAKMMDADFIKRRAYRTALALCLSTTSTAGAKKKASVLQRAGAWLARQLVLAPLLDKEGLNLVRVGLTSAATLSPDLYRVFRAMGVSLRNFYGSTEVGWVTVQDADADPETLGRFTKVDPAFGEPLQHRVVADELQVRGGTGFCGYYNAPEATQERLTDDGWYCTGDAVLERSNGELVFWDRVTELKRLKTGVRLSPQFIETRLRFSPFVKECVVLGDERKEFVAALVQIDPEIVGQWAERRGVAYASFAELSQRPEVLTVLTDQLQQLNDRLPADQRVRRFASLPKELDPDDGELTRTRKLRRSVIDERYAPLIDAIYRGMDRVSLVVPIVYEDGTKGTMSAEARVLSLDDGRGARGKDLVW